MIFREINTSSIYTFCYNIFTENFGFEKHFDVYAFFKEEGSQQKCVL